jgi:adenosine deaminase
MAQHPAAELLALGLAVTISTDTRTTADSTLRSEFEALGRTFGWGPAEHDLVQANAHAAAFGSTKERPGAAGTTTGPQENPATGARP